MSDYNIPNGIRWMIRILLTTAIVFSFMNARAQDHDDPEKSGHKTAHRGYISFVLGHSYLSEAQHAEENKTALTVPTLGLDFGYKISKKLALIWANEIQIQEYLVSNDNVSDLEREYPYITAIELQYLLTHNLALIAGPGIELEKNKNLFIFRIGAEMDFMIGENWAFIPSLIIETKENKYNSITLGFGIARGF